MRHKGKVPVHLCIFMRFNKYSLLTLKGRARQLKISFKFMKKLAAFVFIAVFLTLILAGCGADKVLYVYNWEYISDGSEGTLNVKALKICYELTGEKLDIRYTTYPSVRDLYAKMTAGAEYDIFRQIIWLNA